MSNRVITDPSEINLFDDAEESTERNHQIKAENVKVQRLYIHEDGEVQVRSPVAANRKAGRIGSMDWRKFSKSKA